jgi:hypothetical protein
MAATVPLTAIGFGYYGGAMNVYDAFFAKGSNVELPANTPIFMRIDEKAQRPGGTDLPIFNSSRVCR